jgi:hypothetical protein
MLSGFCFCQIALMLCMLPLAVSAADVSGTLVINNKEFKLSYGYIDMLNPEEPLIVLSDKPLPDEEVPYLSTDYSVQNKVHAIIFGIILKDKKISNDLAQLRTGGDYSSPAVGYPVEMVSLQLKRADESVVEGAIKTTKPVIDSDLTYSFSASFKLSAKAALEKANAPKEASFSGDDSAPVKVYREYYRAIMAGDAAAMKKHLCAKSLKEFEEMADPRDQAMVMDLMKMRPAAIEIAEPVIAGNEATFKAEGKEGTGVSTGAIKMTMENGQWTVLEDKWSTVFK